MAALDDLLLLVEAEHARGREPAGLVGGERVDAVGGGGALDRGVVALPGQCRLAGARADLDGDQPVDVGADDLANAPLDLGLGLVVAAAEPALHAGELLLGLGEGALSGGGDLLGLL